MDNEFDIGWSNRVGKDLLAIKSYLVENVSEAVAEKVIIRLFSAVEPTRTQPERFPYEPRFRKYGNFRYIKVWSYKIIYEFTGNQIIVHRIVHSKRDLRETDQAPCLTARRIGTEVEIWLPVANPLAVVTRLS